MWPLYYNHILATGKLSNMRGHTSGEGYHTFCVHAHLHYGNQKWLFGIGISETGKSMLDFSIYYKDIFKVTEKFIIRRLGKVFGKYSKYSRIIGETRKLKSKT